MDRKRIVCFGDSNTWGYDADTGGRFGEEVRWTSRLQKLLGEEWEVISEGLSGRTAVCDDPLFEGLNGLTYLHPCLMSHSPVELCIIMLGTNDTKERLSLTAMNIAQGITRLAVKARSVRAGLDGNNVDVMVVCPPVIGGKYRDSEIAQSMGEGCDKKSRELSKHLETLLGMEGIPFFDSGKRIGMNDTDCMHLDRKGHHEMALAIERMVNQMTGKDKIEI